MNEIDINDMKRLRGSTKEMSDSKRNRTNRGANRSLTATWRAIEFIKDMERINKEYA